MFADRRHHVLSEARQTDLASWVTGRGVCCGVSRVPTSAIVSPRHVVQVKTDTVLVMLKKKKSGKRWACVTEREKLAKEMKR